ncbi:MAG: hypothetical protein Ct9H300mP1_36730 [Planctomycetaceae bacterium]|nr:MAG: hypothetical protein Ct9H300mP1_36730 [Planctomycetaceae bacterium]
MTAKGRPWSQRQNLPKAPLAQLVKKTPRLRNSGFAANRDVCCRNGRGKKPGPQILQVLADRLAELGPAGNTTPLGESTALEILWTCQALNTPPPPTARATAPAKPTPGSGCRVPVAAYWTELGGTTLAARVLGSPSPRPSRSGSRPSHGVAPDVLPLAMAALGPWTATHHWGYALWLGRLGTTF